jgi:hypothetical protein
VTTVPDRLNKAMRQLKCAEEETTDPKLRDKLRELGSLVSVCLTDLEEPPNDNAVEIARTALLTAARRRLTEYMLGAPETEPDGTIHRSGIIAAVLNVPREVVDAARPGRFS